MRSQAQPDELDAERIVHTVAGLRGTGELLDSLALGFIAVDCAYRVLSLNAFGGRLIGVDPGRVRGTLAWTILERDFELDPSSDDSAGDGALGAYQATCRRWDGGRQRIHVVPRRLRVRDGRLVGHAATFTPVDHMGQVLHGDAAGRLEFAIRLPAPLPT